MNSQKNTFKKRSSIAASLYLMKNYTRRDKQNTRSISGTTLVFKILPSLLKVILQYMTGANIFCIFLVKIQKMRKRMINPKGNRQAKLFIHTANEGPERIQYKCLVPIYMFIPRNETAGPCYFQNRNIIFCLPISTFMYLYAIYIFPGLVCLYISWNT